MALMCLFFSISYSQDRVSMMFYNLLNFPNVNGASRTADLSFILNTYQPDIFAVCELNNSSGASTILGILQGIDSNYQMVTFVTNSSDDMNGDSNSLQQMVFYNDTKVILETQHAPVPTTLRDFNHYTFKLNADDVATNPVFFDLYVTHLKASSGVTNENERLAMVNEFTTHLGTLPSDRPVILAGDFNFYSSSEPGNQELLDNSNNITLMDPANRQGSWHNNSSFIDVFSQSTSTTSINGGASGGFDDRFDFIYLSENFGTNPDLIYSPGSYRTIGNNSNINCYNQSITSNNCSGANYDFTMRNALRNFSDHLPIMLEIETDKTLSTPNFETSEEIINLVSGNMVDDQLTIQLKNTNLPKPKLILFNTLGQIIKRLPVANDTSVNIPVNDLSPGMYYIRLENSNIEALKFIKK